MQVCECETSNKSEIKIGSENIYSSKVPLKRFYYPASILELGDTRLRFVTYQISTRGDL